MREQLAVEEIQDLAASDPLDLAGQGVSAWDQLNFYGMAHETAALWTIAEALHRIADRVQ